MGRSSTEMHAIDLVDDRGRLQHMVLLRYVEAERLKVDPWYRPEQEVEALRVLEEARIPAPRLIAEDARARRCDVPALLQTRILGRPARRRPADMEGYLRQAAELLLSIHAVDPVRAAGLSQYEPYEPPWTMPIPSWSTRPALWPRVLEALSGPAPVDEGRFIHRDYHPGNILVAGGRIAGVVDWPTACLGPRSIDLARMRLNLAGDFGVEWADRFLALYRERAGSGWSHHPYWDLLDAVDSAQDTPRPGTAREVTAWDRFERWVEGSLVALRGG